MGLGVSLSVLPGTAAPIQSPLTATQSTAPRPVSGAASARHDHAGEFAAFALTQAVADVAFFGSIPNCAST
ncbi:MAG TPA: hypothetical protein VL424_20465 [Pararobbsia sp.]|nr:hypothetical protein [Pararobbsia sp.]